MFDTTVLSAMVDALRVQIDAGDGPATLTFYSGVQPPAGGPPTGTVQAEVALEYPCGTVSGATLTIATPLETMRTGSQDITWSRMRRHDGSWLMDLTAGLTGSGAHIELDAVAGYAGGTVTLTAALIGF
jgi:hypothetical protein